MTVVVSKQSVCDKVVCIVHSPSSWPPTELWSGIVHKCHMPWLRHTMSSLHTVCGAVTESHAELHWSFRHRPDPTSPETHTDMITFASHTTQPFCLVSKVAIAVARDSAL